MHPTQTHSDTHSTFEGNWDTIQGWDGIPSQRQLFFFLFSSPDKHEHMKTDVAFSSSCPFPSPTSTNKTHAVLRFLTIAHLFKINRRTGQDSERDGGRARDKQTKTQGQGNGRSSLSCPCFSRPRETNKTNEGVRPWHTHHNFLTLCSLEKKVVLYTLGQDKKGRGATFQLPN